MRTRRAYGAAAGLRTSAGTVRMARMAAARPKSIPLSTPEVEAEPTSVEPPATGLAAFFAELEVDSIDEVSLGIYEVREGDKQNRSYLMQLPGAEVDPHTLFDFVLGKYGPGTYEALAKRGHKFAGGWKFSVGAKPVDDRTPLEKAYSRTRFIRPPIDAVAVNTQDVAAPFTPAAPRDKLEVLIEQNAALLDELKTQRDGGGAKSSSSFESMRDFVGVIAMVKEMFPQTPPAPTANVLDIVKDVLKLKKHLNDDDGDADPMARALASFVPMLTSAIEKLDATQPPATPAMRRRPGGEAIPDVTLPKPLTTPTPTPAPAGLQQVAVEPQIVRALEDFAPYVPILLNYAAAGTPPDEVALTVLDQLDTLDDEKWNDAAELIFHPLVLNLLAGVEPRIAAHEAWLRELVDALQELMKADSTETPTGIADADQDEPGPQAIPDATSDAEA